MTELERIHQLIRSLTIAAQRLADALTELGAIVNAMALNSHRVDSLQEKAQNIERDSGTQ
jgi:hypothetical protein